MISLVPHGRGQYAYASNHFHVSTLSSNERRYLHKSSSNVRGTVDGTLFQLLAGDTELLSV